MIERYLALPFHLQIWIAVAVLVPAMWITVLF